MTPNPLRREWKFRAGPSGLHLFDRATGQNVLLDEVQVAPRQWSPAPRQVSVALTNSCDLSCPFCFAPKNDAELPFERLSGWLAELDAGGCLGVGFGGGEPTVYPRLIELCRFAAERTHLAVTLTTHAHSVDSALADALEGAVHFIRVSMDGVGSTYEALRGRSFLNLLARLEFVKQVAPFGINCLVNNRTLPCLNAVVDVAAEWGASELLLLPERLPGDVHTEEAATALRLQEWVEAYRGPVPLSVSVTDSQGLLTCSPFPGELELEAFAHVDASGVLKRTSFDQHGIAIGDAGILHAVRELGVLGKAQHK